MMKIPYLSNHRYDFSLQSTYNNGGWIESLTSSISELKGFDVSVAYFAKRNSPNIRVGQINFYPVDFNNQLFLDRVKRYFSLDKSLRKKQTIDLMNKLRNGVIGETYKALAFYHNNRPEVPNQKVVPIPSGLDWDEFQGPAVRRKYTYDTWDYNWRWYGVKREVYLGERC